jgi:hypothetical protein
MKAIIARSEGFSIVQVTPFSILVIFESSQNGVCLVDK